MLAEAATGPEEAIAVNTEMIRQAPDDVAALNRLGRAFEAIGRVDEAKQTFRNVLGRNPNNPIALRHLRELERAHP